MIPSTIMSPLTLAHFPCIKCTHVLHRGTSGLFSHFEQSSRLFNFRGFILHHAPCIWSSWKYLHLVIIFRFLKSPALASHGHRTGDLGYISVGSLIFQSETHFYHNPPKPSDMMINGNLTMCRFVG